MSDLAIVGTAYAEAYFGAWIARCPSPWCDSAMQVDRGQVEFHCGGLGGCGWGAPIQWPADPDGVETLLLMRPAPRNRNWRPGESLQDLLAENLAHGILPPGELEAASGRVVLMRTAGDRIVGGTVGLSLLCNTRRHEIEEADHGVDHAAHSGR